MPPEVCFCGAKTGKKGAVFGCFWGGVRLFLSSIALHWDQLARDFAHGRAATLPAKTRANERQSSANDAQLSINRNQTTPV
jgi:hypothetical protein